MQAMLDCRPIIIERLRRRVQAPRTPIWMQLSIGAIWSLLALLVLVQLLR